MPTVLVAHVAVSLRALDTNSTCAKNVRRNEEIYGKRYQAESAGAHFQTGKPAQGTDASGIFTAGADDRAGTAADFDVPFDRRRLQSAGNCRELSPRCDDALAHAGPAGGKRASGAAHQSTVASGVPDLFDRGGKGDGSRGLQLLSRNGKKDVQRAD